MLNRERPRWTLATALLVYSVNTQAETSGQVAPVAPEVANNDDWRSSLLLGLSAGTSLDAPGALFGAHTGFGGRVGRNLIAVLGGYSLAQNRAFLGGWSVVRHNPWLGFGAGHWWSSNWHSDLHLQFGPGFDALSGAGEASSTAFVWTFGLGGGYRAFALHLRYQGGEDSICAAKSTGLSACYQTPGGFQAIASFTVDLLGR